MTEKEQSKLTPISSFGEFGLIDHITKNFPIRNSEVIKAVGDDAAVVKPPKGKLNVFTTDFLLEGVHFDLAYAPLKHLGYKSVVVNISDILAMNAIPYGITISIGLSSRFPVEAIEELYSGIRIACEKYKIDLLGGDTCSSKQGLVISVSAFGFADEGKVVYRDGAKVNDLVCVTGDLGAAYAGFLILDREKETYLKNPDMQPELGSYEYVVQRQLKPEVRIDVIEQLSAAGIQPNAMMDISDGLASELHHICLQSKCGVQIYADKLPIDYQTISVGEEFEISPTTFALNGGEDYELVFTAGLEHFDSLMKMKDVHIIGHVSADPKQLEVVLKSGQVVEMEAQGWEHFRKAD